MGRACQGPPSMTTSQLLDQFFRCQHFLLAPPPFQAAPPSLKGEECVGHTWASRERRHSAAQAVCPSSGRMGVDRVAGRERLQQPLPFHPAVRAPPGLGTPRNQRTGTDLIQLPVPSPVGSSEVGRGQGVDGHTRTYAEAARCSEHRCVHFIRARQPPGCRAGLCSQRGLHARGL